MSEPHLSERFPIRSRIQFGPHTDLWMMGARYGDVIGYDTPMNKVLVQPDKYNKQVWCNPDDINPMNEKPLVNENDGSAVIKSREITLAFLNDPACKAFVQRLQKRLMTVRAQIKPAYLKDEIRDISIELGVGPTLGDVK